MLKQKLLYDAYRIDGDDMRELFSNKDYSIKGRVENVATAQRIAHYLHNQGEDVIVSLVAPYIDQREEFKKLLGDDLVEIYVYTTDVRERDHFKAEAYIAPKDNFIDIDTTNDTPEQSYKKLLEQL
jgi:adenylylsulfate kinase-like enzyme